MSYNDGSRFGRNFCRDCGCRYVIRQRVDVGKDGDCALIKNRRDRAHVGNRRRDDFIAGFRIDGSDRNVNCS